MLGTEVEYLFGRLTGPHSTCAGQLCAVFPPCSVDLAQRHHSVGVLGFVMLDVLL